jgi:glutaredoxin
MTTSISLTLHRIGRSCALMGFAVWLLCGAARANAADIEVFTRDGCPRCTAAKEFLAGLEATRPGVAVLERDVVRDPQALARLREVARERGIGALSVPTFVVGDEVVVGFESAETTGSALLRALDRERPPPLIVPVFGALDAERVGLPLFTIALGLVDGFNPCAMWVLLFILSLLVNLHDRGRMALIGGTFVVVSGVVYFAFMAAWLQVFLLVGVGRAVQVALGAVAVLVGLVNVKDFFAYGRGFSLSIPQTVKPTLYAQARRILSAQNLTGALVATVVLALLVNVVELLCTAGLPAVYTHVLARHELSSWQHFAYLALYNAAYVLDDGLMVAIAVVTLSRAKLQEGAGRNLKLLSGLVMLGLGLLLLAKPGWLG